MKNQPKGGEGRVDQLAAGVFQGLLKRYANPHVRLACAVFDEEIGACFREHLGPGTKAHEVGNKVARALGRISR